MKKIVSLLLVVMMLATLSVSVFAAEEKAENPSASQPTEFPGVAVDEEDDIIVIIEPIDVEALDEDDAAKAVVEGAADIDLAEVAAAAGVEAVELGKAKMVTAKYAKSGEPFYGAFTYEFEDAADNFVGIFYFPLNVADKTFAEPVFLASDEGEVAFPGHGIAFEVFAAEE